MDPRPILYWLGCIIVLIGVAMVIPLILDLFENQQESISFFVGSVITFFTGGMLMAVTGARAQNRELTTRQSFIILFLGSIGGSAAAALPFWFSDMGFTFSSAFFEAASSLTTTGATVIQDIDNISRGMHLWRALLQWVGGYGFIIICMTLLPHLRIGGLEIPEPEWGTDKKSIKNLYYLIPAIGSVYLALSFLCLISYAAAGMTLFDSLIHAMTTISTGGFSTHRDSFMFFSSPPLMIVAIIFMTLSALPFLLLLNATKDIRVLLSNASVWWFLGIISVSTLLLTIFLSASEGYSSSSSLLHALFTTVSMITGTSFFSADYNLWGHFPVSFLLFLGVIGGCAGSTVSGIKIFRFRILYSVLISQIQKTINPRGIFLPQFNGRTLEEYVPVSIMGFVFIYALSFLSLAIALSLTGEDLLTSLSCAIAAISNAGMGFGDILGPRGNFASMTESAQWLLSFGMLSGRLEILPFLVIFSPHFWRV